MKNKLTVIVTPVNPPIDGQMGKIVFSANNAKNITTSFRLIPQEKGLSRIQLNRSGIPVDGTLQKIATQSIKLLLPNLTSDGFGKSYPFNFNVGKTGIARIFG